MTAVECMVVERRLLQFKPIFDSMKCSENEVWVTRNCGVLKVNVHERLYVSSCYVNN
jgi:hypothetical protein